MLLATGLTAAALFILLARVPFRAPVAPPTAAPAPREVVTAMGERSSLTLSDGSRITVLAGSRLTIPGDLGRGGRRQVWLEGEAFFDVVHDSLRPFVVHTRHGVAEDLGTEFVVSTYPEMSGMRLAVREGLVALRSATDTAPAAKATFPPPPADTIALLGPGDVARVSRDGAVAVARHQDVGGFFAAAEGVLALQAVPLRDAIPRIERWYAITIAVPDRALLARRVTGTFREESAESALGSVAMALEARAVWTGTRVTLVMDHQRGELQ
jgi:transmembrane sensor